MHATNFLKKSYRYLAKPVFFNFDPENVHDGVTALGRTLGNYQAARWLTAYFLKYANLALEQEMLGIKFPNPVGLSAGFDKNAELTEIMPAVGFGFAEVGSITGEPCPGNPRPRLWRLPGSQALVVYYGLKNDGCAAVAERLKSKNFSFPVGTSVARTNNQNTVDMNAGINDYTKAFRAFANIGAYTTVNISCPNTCGGEPFTDPQRLAALLTELDKIETKKPVFLKCGADLSFAELDTLVEIAKKHRLHGFILTNLTKKRDRAEILPQEIIGLKHGGVSGKPVFQASNDLISHLYKTTGDRFVIIGCGGIFSAEDAYKKIRCGASLVQLITGMIYQGPQLIGEINKGLATLLQKDGYKNIKEAVGAAHH